MREHLLSLIPNWSGSVLAFGLYDETCIKAIDQNKNIHYFTIMTEKNSGSIKQKGRRKTLHIKKIRKKFKKKQIDVILGNLEEIYPYKKSFIKDSIYIGKNTLYLYGNQEYDWELIKKRYQRYQVTINENKIENNILLKIDISQSKNRRIKDKIDWILDTIVDVIDLIGDILF